MKHPVRCPAGNAYDAAMYAECPCASCWADRASSILAPKLARAPNIESAPNDHRSLEIVAPAAGPLVAAAESAQEAATPSTDAAMKPPPKRKRGGRGIFVNAVILLIGACLSYVVALVLPTRFPDVDVGVAGLTAFAIFLVGWWVASRPTPRPTQSSPLSWFQKNAIESQGGCVLRKRAGRERIAPLTIQAPASHNFVVKLVNVLNNDAEEMVIYVRRRAYYETKVPLGTYKIRGAYGGVWRGEKELFGPNTSYFKLVQKKGASEPFAGANELFTFDRTATGVTGFFVQLVKQAGGNLETSTIGAGEF